MPFGCGVSDRIPSEASCQSKSGPREEKEPGLTGHDQQIDLGVLRKNLFMEQPVTLRRRRTRVYFPTVGKGRKYDLQMKCAPLDNLGQYDCELIVTDHSDYDYARIVRESQLVVDTRNATGGIKSPKIVRCQEQGLPTKSLGVLIYMCVN
jgi:hypothetical protein